MYCRGPTEPRAAAHIRHAPVRYGIWADWAAPYVTLDPAYEAAQLHVFGQMVLNGHIYRGRKPVHWCAAARGARGRLAGAGGQGGGVDLCTLCWRCWAACCRLGGPVRTRAADGSACCGLDQQPHPTPRNLVCANRSPSSRTALAEAELEYPEGHKSRSIYVAMPITSAGANVPPEVAGDLAGAALAIWTTTPWTIPANLAVAVNDQLDYALVEAKVRGAAALTSGRGCYGGCLALQQLKCHGRNAQNRLAGSEYVCHALMLKLIPLLQGDKASGWSHKRLIVAQGLVETLQSKLGLDGLEVRATSGLLSAAKALLTVTSCFLRMHAACIQ